MLKIGVTGGIGVGKTIVCRMFALLGIPIYDSDSRAKWVMNHDLTLKDELIAAFGADAYTTTGELNRAYLSNVAFKAPERLAKLNELVHPHVRSDFARWVEKNAKAPYVIKEAALMYESEAWKQMDQIIAVFAPMPVRLSRILKRDSHRTKADVQGIIDKQLREEEKMARAQHVIYNDDQQLIIPQVLHLHQQFLKIAGN